MIRLYSDLHLEKQPRTWQAWVDALPLDPIPTHLALAGDICAHSQMLEIIPYIHNHFRAANPDIRTWYTPGNHEFWGTDFQTVIDNCTDLSLLDDNLDASVLGDAFDGWCAGTLWYPQTKLGTTCARNAAILRDHSFGPPWPVGPTWSDFELIDDGPESIFDTAEFTRDAISDWLQGTTAHTEPRVVVTHMLPSPACVSSRWIGNPHNDFFVHDLTETIVQHGPTLWLHGHTHDSICTKIGNTEIHCNPRGYPTQENPQFDPAYTIELA